VPGDGEALIRVEGLSKRFGGVTALDDLTVVVPRGTVGLVGAHGAGKTTLLRLLLGLTPPTSGSITVSGVDVVADPVAARERIGFMPEHDCLPTDQSAADVVGMLAELSGLPATDARQRASDVLALVGLDEARFRPIEGYSTGMRQRTKLAQAIVADPQLVLLDEPTAGLDPLGRAEMLDLVRRLSGFGISVLFSTHLLADVERTCDHVVMLSGGRLVVEGATAALLADTGTTRVEVGPRAREAAEVLARRGVGVRRVEGGEIEIDGGPASTSATVCAVLADLGAPLHRLWSGHGSLDEVFVHEAGGGG
jgi:ABC-2 type transport system ATP-binding protein